MLDVPPAASDMQKARTRKERARIGTHGTYTRTRMFSEQ